MIELLMTDDLKRCKGRGATPLLIPQASHHTLYAQLLSPINTTRYVNLILLDLSPEYLMSSTDHKVSRYAVVSIPLLPRPS